MQVAAEIEGRADHVHELGDQLRGLFLRLQHEIEEEQVGDDAVALRKVHREAEAPRFLATHHRARLQHLRRDVLEADGHLVHRHAVLLAEAVDHRAHVHRLHDGLAQLAHLEQVPHEQRVEGQRRNERALLVRQPGAVSVAVDGQADVGPLRGYAREEFVDVRRDRLGIHAAKVGIALGVQLDDLRLPSAEKPREIASGAAEERLADDAVASGTEGLEVEELADPREIVGRRVEDLNKTLGLGVVVLHALDVV